MPPHDVVVAASQHSASVLTEDALAFVTRLNRRFADARGDLLQTRADRRGETARDGTLDFLAGTRVRESEWQVPPPAPGLARRLVEITGPTERKMAINALNSGADVWLADLEDANTPLWDNMLAGQRNLSDAIHCTITYTAEGGKRYELAGQDHPTIVMRPRGRHLDEAGVQVDGHPAVAALVDFGLYFFHNAQELITRGSGPYFYLPKLESHHEAALWAEVFAAAEAELGIAHGTIRATVLIETITAGLEMDEILYALRDYAAGLNAGRWDYLFSLIKTFGDCGDRYVLPDRNDIAMTAPFMRAYTDLLVATCHRRGAMAIGGMAAFIPTRHDPEVNAQALEKVRNDKRREAGDGFDGSWVAHPGLVEICAEEFTAVLGERPNQLDRQRPEVAATADQLLDVQGAPGKITSDGLRSNVSVGIRYLCSWLSGNGAAAINNLMEDVATAEIARSQVWQWVHNRAVMTDGRAIDHALVETLITEITAQLDAQHYPREIGASAVDVFCRVSLETEFVDFLTLTAYPLVATDARQEGTP